MMNNSEFFDNLEEQRLYKYISQELDSPINLFIHEQKYDEALNLVETFLSNNLDKNYNNIVQKSCAAWKAIVFEKKGDLLSALQMSREVCQLTESDDSMYFPYRINLVRIIGLKDPNQSILEAENLLDEVNRDGIDDLFDVLNLLEIYVTNLDICKILFPLKYSSNVADVANYLEINIAQFDLAKSESISNCIRYIHSANKNANNRYSQLVIDLSSIKEQTDRSIALLSNYIERESFAFYRNLAIESLSFFQAQN